MSDSREIIMAKRVGFVVGRQYNGSLIASGEVELAAKVYPLPRKTVRRPLMFRGSKWTYEPEGFAHVPWMDHTMDRRLTSPFHLVTTPNHAPTVDEVAAVLDLMKNPTMEVDE